MLYAHASGFMNPRTGGERLTEEIYGWAGKRFTNSLKNLPK